MEEYVVEQIIKLDIKLKKYETSSEEKKQILISKLNHNSKFSALTHQCQKEKISKKEIKKLDKTIEKLENTKRELTLTCNAYFKMHNEIELDDWTQKAVHRNVKREIARAKRNLRKQTRYMNT